MSLFLQPPTCFNSQGTSDPYAVVTLLPSDRNDTPAVLGKTEVVHNTLSPEWTTTIRLPEYEMGNPTRLAVNIYDHSNNSSNNNKSMGCVMFDVSDILASKDKSWEGGSRTGRAPCTRRSGPFAARTPG
jgi:Ca2+-dependent lipid-binding protein